MRRKDREITDRSEIIALLKKCDTVRVAFADGGTPYIVAMNFGVAENPLRLYFHCASIGRKIDMMEKNPNVCFQADCGHEIVDGPAACAWSMKFESVLGYGRLVKVSDAAEKQTGLEALMHQYGAEGTQHFERGEFDAVTVLRLDVSEISGKRKI